MNDTPILLHKSQISMSKVLNKEKLNIIKMGFLNKRSKYLKMWNKFNILKSRRYIILTNKNMFSFINDEKSADCTMNLKIIILWAPASPSLFRLSSVDTFLSFSNCIFLCLNFSIQLFCLCC